MVLLKVFLAAQFIWVPQNSISVQVPNWGWPESANAQVVQKRKNKCFRKTFGKMVFLFMGDIFEDYNTIDPSFSMPKELSFLQYRNQIGSPEVFKNRRFWDKSQTSW